MPDDQMKTLKLQFARQLYASCLERHGEDDPQTHLVLNYIAALENRGDQSIEANTATT
jgi:hypothetical protein